MTENLNYNAEDLVDHIAIGAIIKDNSGKILMQNHVKYGFWTIPIGKAKYNQNSLEALKEEVLEECNLIVNKAKLLARKDYDYVRKGRNVKLNLYLYEVINYSGDLKNKEPENHSKQEFIDLEEIKKILYLSDATILYLETIGFKRDALIRKAL